MPHSPGLPCFSWLLLSLLAGCALPPEPRVHLSDPPERPLGGYAPALWDRQGLEAQPRMTAYRDLLPVDSSYAPGTTAWREALQEVPTDLSVIGHRHDTPGSLLQALVTELRISAGLGRSMWEQTQRIFHEEGRATGVILQWGVMDDAVQGQDYRMYMRQDARGWFIERLETRLHCGRGVSASDLCL